MIAAAKSPRLLWPIAVLALLWNGFGGYDFLMTNARDPVWVAPLPAETQRWLDAMPLWAIAAWALGVWGGVLGSVLLLVRSRHALAAFAASLVGLAASTAYRAGSGMGAGDVVTVAIWIVAVLLLGFAWRMRRRDVLR